VKELRLRRADSRACCGVEIAAGALERWGAVRRVVNCLKCPTEAISKGVMSGSALTWLWSLGPAAKWQQAANRVCAEEVGVLLNTFGESPAGAIGDIRSGLTKPQTA